MTAQRTNFLCLLRELLVDPDPIQHLGELQFVHQVA
jgi:hypothetical protein